MMESWKRLSFQSATGLKYVAGSDKFKSHRTEYKTHISSNLRGRKLEIYPWPLRCRVLSCIAWDCKDIWVSVNFSCTYRIGLGHYPFKLPSSPFNTEPKLTIPLQVTYPREPYRNFGLEFGKFLGRSRQFCISCGQSFSLGLYKCPHVVERDNVDYPCTETCGI